MRVFAMYRFQNVSIYRNKSENVSIAQQFWRVRALSVSRIWRNSQIVVETVEMCTWSTGGCQWFYLNP